MLQFKEMSISFILKQNNPLL